jgi:hypothetical protein
MIDTNALSTLPDAVILGANMAAVQIIAFIPNLVLAIIALLAGYFIGSIVGSAVQKVFDSLKVEAAFKKYKVEDALGGNQITPLLATIARWYVVLIFIQIAISTLQLAPLTNLINETLLYVPVVFGVMLLVISAAIIGEWIREAILELKKFYLQYTIAQGIKWAIVLMAIVVGLETVGFKMEFVRQIITLILQGIVYGIAIAFGLAFGLGGQKDAADIIRRARKRLNF